MTFCWFPVENLSIAVTRNSTVVEVTLPVAIAPIEVEEGSQVRAVTARYVGEAHRHPTDTPNTEIGVTLALSRAYAQAARELERRAMGLVKHADDVRKERERKKREEAREEAREIVKNFPKPIPSHLETGCGICREWQAQIDAVDACPHTNEARCATCGYTWCWDCRRVLEESGGTCFVEAGVQTQLRLEAQEQLKRKGVSM